MPMAVFKASLPISSNVHGARVQRVHAQHFLPNVYGGGKVRGFGGRSAERNRSIWPHRTPYPHRTSHSHSPPPHLRLHGAADVLLVEQVEVVVQQRQALHGVVVAVEPEPGSREGEQKPVSVVMILPYQHRVPFGRSDGGVTGSSSP